MRELLEEFKLLEFKRRVGYGEAGLSRRDLKMRAWQDLDSGFYQAPEDPEDRKYYDEIYAKADAEDVKAGHHAPMFKRLKKQFDAKTKKR